MANREEIQATILEVLYDSWEENPFSTFTGDSIGEEVESRLGEEVENKTMHHILQGMDDQLFLEHTAAVGSLGMVSARVRGIERYAKSNSSFLDDQSFLQVLEYLIESDDEEPGQYVNSEEVQEHVELPNAEIERNIWYLDKNGSVELMQAIGSTWIAARVEPAGRRTYQQITSHDQTGNPDSSEGLTDSEYDVFISHASEDKEKVARPLAEELSERGIEVWFDEFELELGDNLRESIDEGLSGTRYGVVILSDNFFGKNWTEHELEGITAKDMGDGKVLLPLWFEIDKETIQSYSPPLANKVAGQIHEDNIPEIAEEIYGVISGRET
ncbi:TIR domain-containing protein [Haloferax volcanii]|uniref:TIR domain-containing protein n=1 Tax=Haloferax volcanii TaxID=2246 RepID=UPI00385D8C8E